MFSWHYGRNERTNHEFWQLLLHSTPVGGVDRAPLDRPVALFRGSVVGSFPSIPLAIAELSELAQERWPQYEVPTDIPML